jgi:hypothetical protein
MTMFTRALAATGGALLISLAGLGLAGPASAGGANSDGPYTGYATGMASYNGNGKGKAVGRPDAGSVGKADQKNPPGQVNNDTDNGYECDENSGIAKTNPAHTQTCKLPA